MRLRTLVNALLMMVAAALVAGCAATGITPLESLNANGAENLSKDADPEVYRFNPGDQLSVRAVNRPELTVPSLYVDPYGFISYPYLGQVQVMNLTAQEISDRLAQGLRDGDYYKRVDLGVNFLGSKDQFVYVLGEVKKPGPIAFTGRMTLLDAIGLAGGQTYDSEMSTVLWVRGRQKPPGVVKIDLSSFGDARSVDPKLANLPLIPGDVVYIPDSAIASVQRFANRMFDIIRPFVALETGIILYDSVELILRGAYPRGSNNSTTIIVNPLNRN